MTLQEALETTKIHSVVGKVKDTGIMSYRPFRSPHHTIYGVTPICKIRLCVVKPHRLPLPDPKDMSLGAELKRRRLALEWTQEDTAQHFGVLKDSYQNWEWNEYVPHIQNRKKVVKFLGYNFWDDGTDLLSNRVLLYRIEHRLTMSELASKISISTRTIERVENIEKNVSSEMREKIIQTLKC